MIIYKNNSHKKVIGKMKDEMMSKQMTEWIALRSKCYDYSYLEDDKIKNKIKNKGIQKCVVEKNMNQLQFKECLFENKNHYEKVHSLHSKKHNMIITETNKLALNNFDMKRYICDDGINTNPFGYNIENNDY